MVEKVVIGGEEKGIESVGGLDSGEGEGYVSGWIVRE